MDIPLKSHSPTPTKKRHRKEGAKWTRSGCLTCKSRRKRCDEAKPSCQNCVRLGINCEGYSSIWATPLSPTAQVFQDREAPKRRRVSLSSSVSGYSEGLIEEQPSPNSISTLSTCPPASPSSPLDYEEEDVIEVRSLHSENSFPDKIDDFELNSHQIDTLSIIPRPSKYISHLLGSETHYLQYHVEQGSKLMANLESDDNPLRALIIPRALSSPLLMEALCSVSAIHLANRSHDSFHAQTAAAGFYIRTMRGLRATLAECPAGIFPDDAILSVALLCKYEILRGSVKQWAVHLNALEKLVISRGGFDSLDRDTAEFLWGLFVYAQNVAKITNRRQITNAISGTEISLRITKLDIYIGYTEDIIKTCARIADLPSLSGGTVELASEIYTIDESLRNWTHTAKPYIIPKGLTEANLERLRMVAECFRDAAYIYLHSILERMSQGTLSSPWSLFISLTKQGALQRFLERVRSFQIDGHCEYSALTFPLFIAGCESEVLADRELIIQSLTGLETNFGIGNVKRAKELLNVLWMGERKHWLDVLEKLQWDLILT